MIAMATYSKTEKLKEIEREIENCSECKEGKGGKAVPGEGSPDAKIVFIGEAPGKNESITGRPFIGRSGKLLRENIRRIGLIEKEVYITSPVKYLPSYKTPNKKDIEHGMGHLEKQLSIIRPRLIVLLGKVASFAVLGRDIPVAKMHGGTVQQKYLCFITFHPSAAIRFKRIKILFEEDFNKLAQRLKPL